MPRVLRLFVGVLLCAFAASGQSLLPAKSGDWSSASVERPQPRDWAGVAGEDGPLLSELGLMGIEQRTYTRGNAAVRASIFQFRDSTAAYAFFQHRRTTEMRPAEWTEFSARDASRGVFLSGQFVGEVEGAMDAEVAPLVKELLAGLKAKTDSTPYPTLGNYLPLAGLRSGSERYLLGPVALEKYLGLGRGDWLKLNEGGEAQLARYRGNGGEFTLVLVAYPTPQIAKLRVEELRSAFQAIGDTPVDPERRVIGVRRISSLVAIALEPPNEAAAQSLLARVKYEQRLTVNEPGFRATEEPLIRIIYSILVATGTILLFAFVAGLAFGGFRLLVKRLLPGKVFDRPEQVEVIQLGLRSKPIEAKDFF